MTNKAFQLDYCSDHLTKLRNDVAKFSHGGVFLDSEQVARFVAHLEEASAMALNLEHAVSNHEWNRRAATDPVGPAIVPEGNVVLFPGARQ